MLVSGTTLQGRYRLIRALGSGGFSTVYLAEDLRLAGRLVAVKENQDTSPAAMRAFTQEAELLARLQHPNLPRVTDHFTEASGYQYLVMDYVAGENLDDLVKRQGRLDETTALVILREVMGAVAHLHQQQPPIIHRDIKPSNMIRRQLDGRIILVDFGIAKQQVAGGGTLTAARAVTPGFAPPEQYYGRTDARSDVYSLGATLYYLLTGVVPPEAPARSSGYESLTPPRRVDARISAGVEAAVLCAMDLDAARRFSAVEPLAGALLGTGWATTQPVRPAGSGAGAGRWRLAAAGIGLVVVAFLAGILITRQPGDARPVGEDRVAVQARAERSMADTPLAAPGGSESDTPVAAAMDSPTLAALATSTQITSVAPTATSGPEPAFPTLAATSLPTSTPVPPTPTDLLPPTSTPVPPAPTIALAERAFPVSLERLANASTEEGYETPPLGAVVLGGVPFNLPGGRNSVTTQAEPIPNNPTFLVAEAQVERPQRVHLLLTGGDLYSEYQNRPLGLVRLRFASGTVQEERLVAGVNLREWKIFDQATVATINAPNVREVWRTGSRHGGTGVIDMLTIEVIPANRASALVAIELVDESVPTIGSMDPAINWLGLTAVGLESVAQTSPGHIGTVTATACYAGQPFQATWEGHQIVLGCPSAPSRDETVTLQSFAGGFMFWTKSTDEITVLPVDGLWRRSPNMWRAGDDPVSCEEARAAGSLVMGFGRLWCADAEVRSALGTPVGHEQPENNGAVQRFLKGTMVLGPAGQVFILYDDMHWSKP